MSDLGQRASEAELKAIERKVKKEYQQAQKKITEKVAGFTSVFEKKEKTMREKVKAGEISAKELKNWVKDEVYTGKEWRNTVDECTGILATANKRSLNIVREHQIAAFMKNRNYQAGEVARKTGISFDLVDRHTIDKMIRERPTLLPGKLLNLAKDRGWNRKNILSAILQSIQRGDSIQEAAKWLGIHLGKLNDDAMVRYARTAIVAAQSMGRIDMLHDAEKKGIRVRKKWLATMDDRVRDAHADLDGQEQDIDDDFDSELGPIAFPGDPQADPANVWNCRCTLVYVYPDYD